MPGALVSGFTKYFSVFGMLNVCTKCVMETARSRQTGRMVQIQTLGRLAVTGWRDDTIRAEP